MAQDWKKLTIRLKPETLYMMNKLSPSEPAVIIRGMIERWVSKMVMLANQEEKFLKTLQDEGDGNGTNSGPRK